MSTIGSSSAMDNLAALLMLAKPAPDLTPATTRPGTPPARGEEPAVRVDLSDLANALLEMNAERGKAAASGT